MWITRVSINNPVFATMVMVALLVLGLFSYSKLGVEQLPDITLPVVTISVNYPGASPEQVENDITKPIENAVNTISGVKKITSNSNEGNSYTWVQFNLDVNVDRVTQQVRDKLAQIRAGFPREAKDPVVERADTENDQPVATFVLMSKAASQRELTRLAEQTVAKQFERISGVGRVVKSGTVTRQVQVRLKPEQLTNYGLAVDQVVNAIRAANISVPVGTVGNASAEAIVRVDGRIQDPSQFGRVIVGQKKTDRGVVPIYLSQVADIEDGERERDTISRMNGNPAIGLYVFKVQDANLVEVGKRVKAAAEDLKKILPQDVELKLVWASSDWVEGSLNGVKRTIAEGAALTVLIVFLFLASWRSTVITGLTLPIAVIGTFIALYAFGFTLNFMTLMALSLCIGLLIDDAIVVRENIVRHLRMGKDHLRAAREGTEEIGLAVMATTFAIVAVFVPVAFMSGIIGKFFYSFGVTVTVAVLVSLFVSFTLDPMLSSIWKDPAEGVMRAPVLGPILRAFERFVEALHRLYGAVLAWSLGHRKSTLAIAVLSFVASFFVVPLVGTEFVPDVDQGWTSIRLTMPVGASLEYTDSKVRRVEEVLRGFPEIKFMDTAVGTEGGKNTARININLTDRRARKRSQKQIEQAIREAVARIPGVEMKVGWGGPIYVALMGPDDRELERIMLDLKAKVAKIPGITDLETSIKEGTPALSIRLKDEIASELGLTSQQIGTVLRTLVAGETAGYWLAPDGQNYEVNVQLPRGMRTVADDIANLNIATGKTMADGTPLVVPLRQVATITRSINPEIIKRQDLQRRVALYANVKDRPAGDVGTEVSRLVKATQLPPGFVFDVGGQTKDMEESFSAALGALALAVIFIYLILASQFGSFLQPLAIMASLPFSLIGVFLALLVTHTTLNIFSIIGFIMLMGLVTKNAILLVDFANQGQREGKSQREALLDAGQIRLRPILMTTAAMIFGMLPLAMGLGDGAEQQAPMGRAIIGGVITSTLLTLVVVPVIYTYLDRRGRRAARRAVSAGGGAMPLPAHKEPY